MITILGATGNTGSKIAGILIRKGEQVRLVARSAGRLQQMVGKKAQAFAGDALDTEFLVKAFKDSDAVYTLIPPSLQAENFMTYADRIGGNIARALEIAKVKHIVNLSSVGADLASGIGPIAALHNQEERLNRIKGANVLHIRASYFMENLLVNIDLIKSRGIMGSAMRGDMQFPMIAARDIAAFAADCLVKRDFTGSSVRYLLGQRDLSLNEAARIIGQRINSTNLAYMMVPYNEAEKGMVSMGLSPDMSRLYVEMSRAFNEGRITSENRTARNSTPTSFEEFCDIVFVPAFTQKKAA